MATVSVQLGLLAIAKDRAHPDLGDAEIATTSATSAGHRVVVQQVVGDDQAEIRETLERWIEDATIDAIIVVGDSDAVSGALAPLVSQVLPGFTDLFRWLNFQEAGASAMLASAEAARCNETFVFVLPGAIAAAMEKLILPQFDPATTPKNLIGQMPRMRTEPGTPETTTDEASSGHGVPREVPIEKTQGGSGMPARLPAMPAPRRDQKRTGANVIARAPADPPTRPIELARLEQEIAASANKDDVTRRTDLQKLLPRVPPGADEAEGIDDVTHTDMLAAPPLPAAKPFAIPDIAKPVTTINPRKRNADEKTPIPSVAKPNGASKPEAKPATKPVEAKPATKPVEAKPATKPVEAKPASTRPSEPPGRATPKPASTPPPAPVKPAPPPVTAKPATTPPPVKHVPASTAVGPAPAPKPTQSPISARTSGSIGVLSDADLEPVDIDREGSDLDAIRAAATGESDEAPTVSRAEPVRVPAASTPPPVAATPVAMEAPRTRPPTAPPPAKRTPTTPPPPRETSELPRGAFNYPTQRRGMHWGVKLLLVLVVLGAGFGGFVFFFRDKLSGGTTTEASKEIDAAVIAAVEIDAAAPAVVEPDAAAEPEIEISAPPTPTPTPTPNTTATNTSRTRPRGDRSQTPVTTTTTGTTPVTSTTTVPPVDAAVALPTPPTGPSNTPAGTSTDECDETACVLSNYDKPCCAKFKPATTGDIAPRAGGVPETLDKAMVRAGINGVKPKVQKCGEKNPTKGTVKVSMTVSADGAVTEASVADSPDASLGECVVGAMKLAKFGKSLNGATFTYPFVF